MNPDKTDVSSQIGRPVEPSEREVRTDTVQETLPAAQYGTSTPLGSNGNEMRAGTTQRVLQPVAYGQYTPRASFSGRDPYSPQDGPMSPQLGREASTSTTDPAFSRQVQYGQHVASGGAASSSQAPASTIQDTLPPVGYAPYTPLHNMAPSSPAPTSSGDHTPTLQRQYGPHIPLDASTPSSQPPTGNGEPVRPQYGPITPQLTSEASSSSRDPETPAQQQYGPHIPLDAQAPSSRAPTGNREPAHPQYGPIAPQPNPEASKQAATSSGQPRYGPHTTHSSLEAPANSSQSLPTQQPQYGPITQHFSVTPITDPPHGRYGPINPQRRWETLNSVFPSRRDALSEDQPRPRRSTARPSREISRSASQSSVQPVRSLNPDTIRTVSSPQPRSNLTASNDVVTSYIQTLTRLQRQHGSVSGPAPSAYPSVRGQGADTQSRTPVAAAPVQFGQHSSQSAAAAMPPPAVPIRPTSQRPLPPFAATYQRPPEGPRRWNPNHPPEDGSMSQRPVWGQSVRSFDPGPAIRSAAPFSAATDAGVPVVTSGVEGTPVAAVAPGPSSGAAGAAASAAGAEQHRPAVAGRKRSAPDDESVVDLTGDDDARSDREATAGGAKFRRLIPRPEGVQGQPFVEEAVGGVPRGELVRRLVEQAEEERQRRQQQEQQQQQQGQQQQQRQQQQQQQHQQQQQPPPPPPPSTVRYPGRTLPLPWASAPPERRPSWAEGVGGNAGVGDGGEGSGATSNAPAPPPPSSPPAAQGGDSAPTMPRAQDGGNAAQEAGPATPRSHRDIWRRILDEPTIMLFLCTNHMPPDVVMQLYAIDKRFHFLAASHFPSLVKGLARTHAKPCPEALIEHGKITAAAKRKRYIPYVQPDLTKVYPSASYRWLNIRDPRRIQIPGSVPFNPATDHRYNPHNSQTVPGFKYLRMLLFRAARIRQILEICLYDHHMIFPPATATALAKIWYLMDLPSTAGRIALIHNKKYFSSEDLHCLTVFSFKLDLIFNDPLLMWPPFNSSLHAQFNRYHGSTFLRRLLWGQRSLSTMADVLARIKMTNALHVVNAFAQWHYRLPGPRAGRAIFGVPGDLAGGLEREGWGNNYPGHRNSIYPIGLGETEDHKGPIRPPGRARLIRPDEAVKKETIRRRMRYKKKHYRKMLKSGFEFVDRELEEWEFEYWVRPECPPGWVEEWWETWRREVDRDSDIKYEVLRRRMMRKWVEKMNRLKRMREAQELGKSRVDTKLDDDDDGETDSSSE